MSLWKADLGVESSYDDAIQGCEGVFHVATPMEIIYQGQDGVCTSLLPFIHSFPMITLRQVLIVFHSPTVQKRRIS